ncbi:MAG: FAD-dependent oxidoreductase [Pseudomonadota bacterium]
MAKASLVIVGGGYIGAELAKSLENDLDVSLVEPREAFVHAPAMLRALVDGSVREQALIPYDRLLTNGRLIKSKATSVTNGKVVTEDGSEIEADYIVLSPGASNGGIFKPADESIDTFREAQGRVAQKIRDASSIVIVGAGAVGIELAGEIAHRFPEKSVSLVSADAKLFPGFPAKLGKGLEHKLKAMGVEVILGQRVQDLQSTTEPYSGAVTLGDGRVISADLMIPAIGSKPQTALFDGLPNIERTPDGRVKVDGYLRPSSLPNVFAAGDAVDAGDLMTIVATSRQQPWLAKLLKALAAGAALESQKSYTPWGKAPILVPLGPAKGNSYLIIATFGDWMTKTMKGKDLFVSKYRKLLGYG